MAIAPGIPQSVYVQQGNGQVLVSWAIVSGATGYVVQRSTDGVNYSTISSPTNTQYLDSSVTAGTQYYYQVAASNGTVGSYSQPQSIVPVGTGQMTLGQLRLLAQQKADRVNSNFVTLPEWNTYINQSYFELYDLLVTTFEDYFVQTPYVFTTDGTTSQYPMPSDFFKLMGVDCGLQNQTNAWVTVHKFEFISRNRYVFPQMTSTFAGVFNLRYRLVGNKLMFIPTPAANQSIRVWYVPRLTQLLQDTDIVDGVSGWTEYIVVDVAIKALQKEESDVTVLALQKQALIDRIQSTAMNRDEGEPDTISSTRTDNTGFGPNGDGSFGGY